MFDNKKVAFYTLGCKLNFSETSTIGRQLADIGFIKTEFENKADLYVINTCSVTENANRECRRIIRKAKKNSPKAFIVVTGCFAQLKPKEISDIEGVDMVLGANEKFNLPKLLTDLKTHETTQIHGCEINGLDYFSSYSLTDRTRSFMKIQDGCNYPCTYCTIPLARGKSRCDSIDNIIKNANDIADKGIKEIVITGVNIGEFKDKNDNRNFSDLVKELDNVEQIERYRISSIEPNLINDEVIKLVRKSKKFMPHFHIPMQSGSDIVLGKMKRRYQTKLYRTKIEKIVREVKDVCIGADVIVGFPGETNEEFDKTLNFIKDLPLSYLHVFTYSERENTPAIDMDGVVSKSDRAERSKQLRILSNKLQRAFYEKYLDTEHTALFEQENKEGYLFGFTDNYIKIKIPFQSTICRTKKQARLIAIDDDGIMKAEIA
ncbi:MAG: tRNA (N(6)-L-threonylcarbamoyladenosine(37)-C(2))-methylthiotransferase MtaB [Flavobacteriales bacterium]|jgi:threonylcarbamoyladenosine tRNA methylthiotransferase MtaB|nr:tRNA (N(6)-L-threonylcarbamoyladenosine(37)-C(2))-methylthiotransferase MtaB [Flavobacteriales bacterium]MBT5090050.1 tRNA (N(6)-L-threonylcarbamoyladenosine(37)-C(2))-methylthiotransferase MtaB [Flavobacteriales bacterium]